MRQQIYYKMRQKFITKCVRFFITKCDNFITICDSYYKLRQFYYKMRQLLQNATFIINCNSTYSLVLSSQALKTLKLIIHLIIWFRLTDTYNCGISWLNYYSKFPDFRQQIFDIEMVKYKSLVLKIFHPFKYCSLC